LVCGEYASFLERSHFLDGNSLLLPFCLEFPVDASRAAELAETPHSWSWAQAIFLPFPIFLEKHCQDSGRIEVPAHSCSNSLRSGFPVSPTCPGFFAFTIFPGPSAAGVLLVRPTPGQRDESGLIPCLYISHRGRFIIGPDPRDSGCGPYDPSFDFRTFFYFRCTGAGIHWPTSLGDPSASALPSVVATPDPGRGFWSDRASAPFPGGFRFGLFL